MRATLPGDKAAWDEVARKIADYDIGHPFSDVQYNLLTPAQKAAALIEEQQRRYKSFNRPSKLTPIPHIVREQELTQLTTPNMRGFFPNSSEGKKSKVLTFLDTETDDLGRILTVAAHKVVFNYSKLRFENAEPKDPGFFRVYNPSNVDKNIVRTFGSHGLSSAILGAFRKNNNVQYSSNWDLSQYEALQKYIGDSELAGHNIVRADIPWLMRPTGRDFNADTYKKGFFDTLHYAKAITGKESAALQTLAKKFNLTPQSMGLKAHDSASDVVTNIKVLEALIKTNISNPFTAEALYAFGLKGVQTGFKQPLNLAEGQGQIIFGARGKPLHNLPYAGAKQALRGFSATRGFKFEEPQVLDIKSTFDIPTDVYDNARSVSGYIGENYGEEQLLPVDEAIMADYGPIKTLVDRFRYLDTIKPQEPSGSFDADSRRIIRYLKTKVSRTGKGAGDTLIDTRDIDDDLRTMLRDAGFGDNPGKEVMQRFARRALQENAYDYWQRQVRLNEQAGNIIKKDSAYAGQSWYDRFAAISEEDMSLGEIAAYKEDKKRYLKQQKEQKAQRRSEEKYLAKLADARYAAGIEENQWRVKHEESKRLEEEKSDWSRIKYANHSRQFWAKESINNRLAARDQRKQTSDAYAAGLLTKGDLDKLSELTVGTKQYGEALADLTKKTAGAKNIAKAFGDALNWYNPTRLLDTAQNEREHIKHAASGILPSFLQKPAFRFWDAMHNGANQITNRMRYGLDMASKTAQLGGAAAGAVLGTVIMPGAGTMIGMGIGEGVAKLGSHAIGGALETSIKNRSEGIQERLNMIGFTTTLLGAFADGLKTVINLFGRLGKIWNYMPSYTLHTLTGTPWSKATPMQAADRLVGMQQGTTANLLNQLQYQSADLYTSGMYNETQLVAAARLGIFDLAYGSNNLSAERKQEMIYDKLYRDIYESGKSDDEVRSQLSLIKNYSPELVSYLERGHELYRAGYKGFRNFSAFTDNYGRNFLSTQENAKVSMTSTLWGLDQESFKQGLALAGTKAYALAEPLITALEKGLWSFVREGKIDWDAIGSALEKVLNSIDIGSIDWKDKLKALDPIIDALVSKLEEIKQPLLNFASTFLGDFINRMGMTKIQFNLEALERALVKGDVTALGDIISVINPQDIGKVAAEGLKKEYSWGRTLEQVSAPTTMAFANAVKTESDLKRELKWGDVEIRSLWNNPTFAKYRLASNRRDAETSRKGWLMLSALKGANKGLESALKDYDILRQDGQLNTIMQQLTEPLKDVGFDDEMIKDLISMVAYKPAVKSVLEAGDKTVGSVLQNIWDSVNFTVEATVDDRTSEGTKTKLNATMKKKGR